MANCKSCGADIFWVTMDESGKKMPIDAQPKPMQLVVSPDKTRGRFVQTWQSHFSTCPNADAHRKVQNWVEALRPEDADVKPDP